MPNANSMLGFAMTRSRNVLLVYICHFRQRKNLERSQRPMEKTIFLRFMYAMTILSSGLTVFEIMQLSTRRFKRQLAKYKLKKQLKKEEQQEDFR